MRRFKSAFLATTVCIVALMSPPLAAQAKMELIKLADDVYMMQNSEGSSNSVFVITADGVLVFDTDIRTADQTLAAIRTLTNKSVRYIIASHSAGDHATGAWYFREDRPVYIAARNQVRDLYMQEAAEFAERKASSDPRFAIYKDKELVRPDIGFEHAMVLQFGGLTFQLAAEGTAHTNGDLTVYIPQRQLMLMGDLMNNEIHPGQGESGGVYYSQVQPWIEALERVLQRQLAVDTYVPGHGPVHLHRGVKDVEDQKRYFIVMRAEVAKMIQAGKTLEQIQKEFVLPPEFAHYKRPERLKNFLKLFHNQLVERGL